VDQGVVNLTAYWINSYFSYLWPNAAHIQINVDNIYFLNKHIIKAAGYLQFCTGKKKSLEYTALQLFHRYNMIKAYNVISHNKDFVL